MATNRVASDEVKFRISSTLYAALEELANGGVLGASPGAVARRMVEEHIAGLIRSGEFDRLRGFKPVPTRKVRP